MATVDPTSFDAALKEWYTDERVRDLVYEENPWFAMVPKNSGVTGDVYVQPVQYGIPQSRSAVITTALNNKKTNSYVKFNVTTVNDYAAISIDRKTMKISENDRGAFFRAREREIDGMLKALTNSCAHALFRNRGGARGLVHASTAPSGTTLTLDDPEDIAGFEVGMVLEASANDGSVSTDTLRTGSNEITAVTDNGTSATLTGTSAWTTAISGLTTGDYLFAADDFSVKLSGLGSWLSVRNDARAAPSAGESFFGVDRSVHPTRLAGQAVSAVGDPIAEAIGKGCALIGREGGAPDVCFVSHQKFRDLKFELGNRVEYADSVVTPNVGFTGVKIIGSKRPVTVFADHNCPDKFAFLLTKDTWTLISHGPVPEIADEDGNVLRRDPTSDSYEVRGIYYAQLACSAPRDNCVITLES